MVLKVRWLMLLSLQTVDHGDWPGWSYSTTREKQLQGKSGPMCCSYTTAHTLLHMLVEQDGSVKTTLCSTQQLEIFPLTQGNNSQLLQTRLLLLYFFIQCGQSPSVVKTKSYSYFVYFLLNYFISLV